MPRLRNASTGSVVNVSDATAARLGAEWEPLEDEKKAQAKPAKRATKKSDES